MKIPEPMKIGAAKFKAECLGLMDEVEAKGTQIVITKNGRAVARLVPMEVEEQKDPLDFYYIGPGRVHGDIISPMVPLEDYEALK